MRFTIATLLFTAVLCGDAHAQKKNKKSKKASAVRVEDVPLPTGKRFRELAPVDGSFPLLVGGSTNAAYFGTQSEVILNREFGFVTPGNDFKQTAIHPEPGVWKWKKPDSWMPRIKKHDQIIRLHSAISPQCSSWAKDDSRTGEELAKNMEEYLTAVCQRYNDNPRVKWMDVVNETVSRDGTWFGPREGNTKWENPWPQIGIDTDSDLGVPVYIPRAFEIAGRHAPKLKLVYNQHGGMEQPMWEKVKATVLYLRAKGHRVDGIGWQAHIDTGFEKDASNMKHLNDLITWCHSSKLEFHITENTVWVKANKGHNIKGQADTFAAIAQTLISHHKTGVVSWNAWQMCENETKRKDVRGTLFDENGNAKPAYYAVQKELVKARRE